MENGILPVIAIIALVVAIRLAAGAMDRGRIAEYVRSRGGRLLHAKWTPFGPGWFRDKRDRIYRITYRDRDGEERVASCKTSWMSGVYLTEDRLAHPGRRARRENLPERSEESALVEENRRLREELDRLRGGEEKA